MGGKILNIIKKIEEGILFLFLAVILLACFFQVIGRYTPLPFSSAFEEIAVNLFIWMTLLGAGVCVRTHSHMRMDIIDTFLPEKIKPYVDMIRELIGCSIWLCRNYCGKLYSCSEENWHDNILPRHSAVHSILCYASWFWLDGVLEYCKYRNGHKEN